MKCFVCGKYIESNSKGAHNVSLGRPKNYCSKECSNFQKYFNAMRKNLSNIDLDDTHKRLLRGELFRVANSLKISSSFSLGTKIPQAKKD